MGSFLNFEKQRLSFLFLKELLKNVLLCTVLLLSWIVLTW